MKIKLVKFLPINRYKEWTDDEFVEKYNDLHTAFTLNKIYNVINGKICDDNNEIWYASTNIGIINDMFENNIIYRPQFEEVIEYTDYSFKALFEYVYNEMEHQSTEDRINSYYAFKECIKIYPTPLKEKELYIKKLKDRVMYL